LKHRAAWLSDVGVVVVARDSLGPHAELQGIEQIGVLADPTHNTPLKRGRLLRRFRLQSVRSAADNISVLPDTVAQLQSLPSLMRSLNRREIVRAVLEYLGGCSPKEQFAESAIDEIVVGHLKRCDAYPYRRRELTQQSPLFQAKIPQIALRVFVWISTHHLAPSRFVEFSF
jgi:hypothetical protein